MLIGEPAQNRLRNTEQSGPFPSRENPDCSGALLLLYLRSLFPRNRPLSPSAVGADEIVE
jgi:hypothetical protein